MPEKDIEKELFDQKEEVESDTEEKTSDQETTQNKETNEKDLKKKKKKSKKDQLEDQIEDLQDELKDFKDKYYRILAEMENFKKRTSNERIKERKYASQSLADKLIDSLEVFSQALNINTDNKQMQNFLYGFKMIKDMIFNALKDEGVSAIDTKVGDDFNPEIHEAMDTEYDPSQPEHTVLKVTKTGYKFKDRVLRPAFVIANIKPEENEEEKEEENSNSEKSNEDREDE
jgi:molecular chaperone GrpE